MTFGPISGPFWPKNLETKFSQNFKVICYCNLVQKKKNFTINFFIKLEKLHFGHIFGPFAPKPQNKICSKSQALFLFKVTNTLSLCKKSENSQKGFQRNILKIGCSESAGSDRLMVWWLSLLHNFIQLSLN